jgi:hypothetical protein
MGWLKLREKITEEVVHVKNGCNLQVKKKEHRRLSFMSGRVRKVVATGKTVFLLEAALSWHRLLVFLFFSLNVIY